MLQVIVIIFPWYIHDLQRFNMIFSMLFVFCTCRAHNLAENKTNLGVNQKKISSTEPMDPAFFKSTLTAASKTCRPPVCSSCFIASIKFHQGVELYGYTFVKFKVLLQVQHNLIWEESVRM